ncbi:hypothetical protein THOG05_430013 [Vibrio rotiferianus]|nr:hypothetical protein THOG05_430013 [Vibrio rotiferianus]CAH1583062.1 hypothetical protein THOG10_330014 [Vibrio rotiferianus]CAH1585168.1 hypothetical protein THOB06_330014 [Vibrio rotiferianus]CAH1588083.1 hypothetical protein THOE12_90066 [Vibrio rotiferianus]
MPLLYVHLTALPNAFPALPFAPLALAVIGAIDNIAINKTVKILIVHPLTYQKYKHQSEMLMR